MAALEVALLLRLLDKGTAKAGQRNAALIERFRCAGWIAMTARRDEWEVRPQAVLVLGRRLQSLLPTWQSDVALLRGLGLDAYEPSVLASLPRLRSERPAFEQLNRRNWMAATGLGPKRTAKLPAPGRLTKDWVMRLRCTAPMTLAWPNRVKDLQALTRDEQEVLISERQWLSRTGWIDSGNAFTVISVENRGAYIDAPLQDDCVMVESPGWNVETAVELLNSLPPECGWFHFGDLDPNGWEIGCHIARETGRPLRFYVPSFAHEYLDLPQASGLQWPEGARRLSSLEPLIEGGVGLSQESFITDSRLAEDISAFCRDALSCPGEA